MASLRSKYIRFAKATGTGVQTVTGVGFTGKALLLWTTFQAASGATTSALMCVGMTDGILQSCRFINHPGAEATTTSSQDEQTDHIIRKVSATSGATPTVQVAGVFGAFTSDGFTINFTTNDGSADIVHAIVLGGDISAAFTQVKMTVDAPASIDVESVGFRPSAYVVMGGAADEFGTGDYSVGAPFGSIHGFGFSNAIENVCGWTLGVSGGVADCYRGQMNAAVASVRGANVAAAPVLMDARITANLDDGYTITRDVGTTAFQPVQHVLCLKGVRFALGSFTAPLTAIDKSVTVPFEPDLVVAQAMGTTASENTSGLGLAIGAWCRADDESGGTWIGGVDAANPSAYRRSTYADLVIETRNPSSGAAVMQATVADTSADEILFGFSAVSGSADEILFMAIAATETIRGSFVAGEKTTVRAPRAAAFGLDGAVNEHIEAGKLKVFGKLEATETVQVGDVSGVTATALIGRGPGTALEQVTVGTGLDLTDNVLTATGGGTGGGGIDESVVAASSESVSNNTLQDDNELFLSVIANAVYIVELVAFFTTGTDPTPDVKFGFTFPASAVMTYSVIGAGTSATGAEQVALTTNSLAQSTPSGPNSRGVISTAASSASPVQIKGILRTGATAGTLKFQFAQSVTTGGTPLVREANSLLRITKVQGSSVENVILAPGTVAAIPAASIAGRLYLPTDGFSAYRDSGSVWAPWGPIFPLTPPVSGDFAWVNQGGASIDTTNGGIYLLAPAGAGDNLRIRKKAAPSTPYTITAAFLHMVTAVDFPNIGLVFRQSSDGKLATCGFGGNATDVKTSLGALKFTNPTTFSATYASVAFYPSNLLWLRIADDGANRICSWSADGQHWFVLHTIGRTDFLTADEVGFYANSTNATWPVALTLLSWKEA